MAKHWIASFLLSLATLLTEPVLGQVQCGLECPPSEVDVEATIAGKIRVKTLKNFDHFLNWSLSDKLRTYALADPLRQHKISAAAPPLVDFAEKHGYFSNIHPLIGQVSTHPSDIEFVCCLFQELHTLAASSEFLSFATAEVVAKVLAYRDLKIGMRLSIPSLAPTSRQLVTYEVDHIFDLWRGMPAFGLVPDTEGEASLLLFRGTDFSILSERGLASMMSDLDISGPGFRVFQRAQPEIRVWLEKVAAMGKRARLLGFSLGGALAAYTFTYERERLSALPSMAFCPPGVSEQVLEDWLTLPKESARQLLLYINAGDVIPKVGKLIGEPLLISFDQPLSPLRAHTVLVSGQESYFVNKINLQQENEAR